MGLKNLRLILVKLSNLLTRKTKERILKWNYQMRLIHISSLIIKNQRRIQRITMIYQKRAKIICLESHKLFYLVKLYTSFKCQKCVYSNLKMIQLRAIMYLKSKVILMEILLIILLNAKNRLIKLISIKKQTTIKIKK